MTQLKKDLDVADCLIPYIPPEQSRQKRQPKRPRKPVEHHEDWLALVRADDGKVEIRASSSLKLHRKLILREALERMTGWCNDEDTFGNAFEVIEPQSTSAASNAARLPISPFPPAQNTDGKPMHRPGKRHRSPNEKRPSPSVPASLPPISSRFTLGNSMPTIGIMVGDQAAMKTWFGDAFNAAQQVYCRLIAKVWIKKIQPKKQSTNPYNGNHPKDQPKDPDRTRPDYWPSNCPHKEPDHINKQDRITLLVHLISHTPQTQVLQSPSESGSAQQFCADDFLSALEERRCDFKDAPWAVIQEIIRARRYMEQAERNEIGKHMTDADTVINLPHYRENPQKGQEDSEDGDAEHDEIVRSRQNPTKVQKRNATSLSDGVSQTAHPMSLPMSGDMANDDTCLQEAASRFRPAVRPDDAFSRLAAQQDLHEIIRPRHTPLTGPASSELEHIRSPLNTAPSYFPLSHPHDAAFQHWHQHGMPVPYMHGAYAGHMIVDDHVPAAFDGASIQHTPFPSNHMEETHPLPGQVFGTQGFDAYGMRYMRGLPIRPGSNPFMNGGGVPSASMGYYHAS